VERLSSGFADWSLVTRAMGPGKWLLDLRELIRRQVQALGVKPPSVRTVNVCTVCHPELFYSYRRDGHARQTMVSGIMLTRRKRSKKP
jgi:copper oxidase (laccase) domain-containing protein